MPFDRTGSAFTLANAVQPFSAGGGTSAPATSTAAPSSQAVNDLLGAIGQGNTATGQAAADAATQQGDLATQQQDLATQQQDQLAAQGDRLSQQGYGAEAAAYGSAASIAGTNSQLALASGAIQAQQTARKVYQTESSTQAATGGNGFGAAGSSVYLMASNAQQGALAEQMNVEQGEIQSLGYKQQGAAATAEQAAVQQAGSAAGIAAQGEDVAAGEAGTQAGFAGTQAGIAANAAGQATTGAQASYTNAQNAITALTANTGGIGAPNNTILRGIQTSLTGSLASPGTLANPILNYGAVPAGVQNSTFGGTTAVGPTGGALNSGAISSGGGVRLVGDAGPGGTSDPLAGINAAYAASDAANQGDGAGNSID